jgi:hypothetical protein
MRHSFLLGVICIVVAATSVSAAPDLRASDDVRPQDLPQVQVLSQKETGVDLLFDLPVLEVDDVQADGRAFQLVEIPGGEIYGEVGSPAIPAFTRLVAVPEGATVTVNAIPEDEVELQDYRLLPMQADEGSEFAYDANAYARAGFDVTPRAKLGEPAYIREMRVVPITVQPVQFDPARGVLKVTSRMRLEVRFERSDPGAARSAVQAIPSSFDALYRQLVVNYSEMYAGAPVRPGTVLLISANDSGVVSRLQPWIEWRTRRGSPVTAVTTATTGTTATSIKNYIQTIYNSANPPLEYVVLAGDASGTYGIPTNFESLSGYGGEGDHPYTQLAGGDILADVHIGRLSFSSYSELEVIVGKIVGYESAPYLSDPGWYKRACLVGDPGSSGYSTVQVQQWIKTRLKQLAYTQIDTIYTSPWVSQMSTALNRGDTIFSYRGYWQMSGWSNTNTYALTNGWKMPFVVSITCDTGSFYSDTSCRTEGFLRAGSVVSGVTNPKGGIGAIGTATTGTHTRFNNCVHYGVFYGLIYEDQFNLGAALTRGKMELYLNYQAMEPNKVIIWSQWNNLMGDPAVECWTGFPDPITVTHPASIALGTNSVTVSVQDAGGALADAQVCLWKGTETYAVGFTDAQGQVELPVSTPTTGNLMVTVTKHNRYPYKGTITVAAGAKYVAYQASTVDDDSVGESLGNGDGLVNPGETIELRVQLKNFGSQVANDVTATLTSDDPYVTITDASETFGAMVAGATAWSVDDFNVVVNAACPAGRVLRLGLDIASGADQWHSLIDLPVVNGDLKANGYTLSNAGANGLFDPGETVQLSVKLVNNGGASAISPTATLFSESEFVDVPDAQGSYGTIGIGATVENTGDTFTIHSQAATYQGYIARFKLVVTFSGGDNDTTYVQVPVGQRTSDDPSGPDRYGYYAFDNTDTSYPEAPVYGWLELDPTYGGSGATEVVLGDMGEYQDKSKVVDIPFATGFKYYGQTYTKATICSNGWVAMGSQWNTEYRNWTIPGAGGPQAMIAPFWDDLYQGTGSKVYQKYDSANHQWIIEWSRLKNAYNNANEVFEVIILDPVYHPTETGDGEIIFQYNTVSNVDATDMYATAGIENADQSDGLLWTYYNQYTPGSASLVANRAIRFIPMKEVMAGQLSGFVRNETAGLIPITGAKVKVLENGHEYLTLSDGRYAGTELGGTYTLMATHAGFQPDTVGSVVITPGSSIQVDFALRDVLPPTIYSLNVASTDDTIGPYPVNATLNDLSPLAETKVFYRIDGGEFTAVDLLPVHGSEYEAQIPGQHWSTRVDYYIYARDAGGNEATDPRGAPANLYTFYVAPTVTIFSDDFEVDRGWTVGGPGDTATSGLWLRCDPNATFHDTTMVQTEDDHTGSPGTNCFVTGNAPVGAGETAADVDDGQTTLTSMILFPPIEGTVTLRYWRWFSNDTDLFPNEDEWVAQVSDDDGQTWIDLERTKQSARYWKKKEFNLSLLIDTTGDVRVRFIAQDINNLSVVEAAVDDVEVIFIGKVGVADASEPAGALRFGLSQCRPNPFGAQTAIQFAIEKASPARLMIYDVQGRVLRRLVDDNRPAGSYTVVWDGRDDSGHRVPSGIYLYRLEAGERAETRKMILVD